MNAESEDKYEAKVLEALGWEIAWRTRGREGAMRAWVRRRDPDLRSGPHYQRAPWVSRDMQAAYWYVVRGMEMLGYHMRLTTPFQHGEKYLAGFTRHGATGFNGRPDYVASSGEPAKAICEAALLTLRSRFMRRASRGAGE